MIIILIFICLFILFQRSNLYSARCGRYTGTQNKHKICQQVQTVRLMSLSQLHSRDIALLCCHEGLSFACVFKPLQFKHSRNFNSFKLNKRCKKSNSVRSLCTVPTGAFLCAHMQPAFIASEDCIELFFVANCT